MPRSASAKTMFGLLPPSSSVSALDRVGAEPHDLAARPRRARERDLVDARMPDEVGARRRPVARDDVDRARRKADLGRELGEPKRSRAASADRASGRRRTRRRARARASTSPSGAGSSRARSGRRRRPAPSASRRGASRRPDSTGRRSVPIADAKKRKFSTAPPISALTDEIALPTLRDSSSASSLRFALIASASACRRRERSFAGVLPQSPSSAARAAATARSISASPASCVVPSVSPVAGSTSSRDSEPLDGLAVDEKAELAGCRDAHRAGRYRGLSVCRGTKSPTRTGSVSSFRKRPRSPST